MTINLIPRSALSQVLFVHDYIQLIFQDEGFSLYNRLSLEKSGSSVNQSEPGFADSLVSLIGLRVIHYSKPNGSALKLYFELGARLCVHLGAPNENGSEAYQFNGPNGLIVVEQN